MSNFMLITFRSRGFKTVIDCAGTYGSLFRIQLTTGNHLEFYVRLQKARKTVMDKVGDVYVVPMQIM